MKGRGDDFHLKLMRVVRKHKRDRLATCCGRKFRKKKKKGIFADLDEGLIFWLLSVTCILSCESIGSLN